MPVFALFVLCLGAIHVNGRKNFEPVINITELNQEVKVDGCATPTMTFAFSTPINVRFFLSNIVFTCYFRRHPCFGVEDMIEEGRPATRQAVR